MTEQELRELIAGGETSRVEFKSWIECDGFKEIKALAIKSAVALANAYGGVCLLGVEDDGTITGHDGKHTCQDLMENIYQGTRPALFTDVTSVDTSDGAVFVISVNQSPTPIATADGKYHRRLGNKSVPYYPGSGSYFPTDNADLSAKIVEGANKSDIDLLEVYKLKEKLRVRDRSSALPDMDDINFLLNLHLIQLDGDDVRLTFAGMLFVGKEESIRKFIPQAEVIYLHYSSGDQTEYDNRQDMMKPIITVLDTLADRIKAFNHITNIQVGLFRLEVYDFAENVFQEALLNALTHRSYESQAPVYVKHYPDKIIIENPGGFPEDVTVDNILTHQSTPRNKLIALTLQLLKYVQRSGQGVDIMYRSMLVDGKPYPEYQVAPASIRLTLRNTIENQGFARFIAEEQDKDGKLFSVQKLMILRYLYEHRRIKLDMAASIIQEPKDTAQKELEQLRSMGLIEPSGREYMLTAKVYEAVKTDVAYVQDKTVTQINARARIIEYLKKKETISSATVQELCGFSKNQASYVLHGMCSEGSIIKVGNGKATVYQLAKETNR